MAFPPRASPHSATTTSNREEGEEERQRRCRESRKCSADEPEPITSTDFDDDSFDNDSFDEEDAEDAVALQSDRSVYITRGGGSFLFFFRRG